MTAAVDAGLARRQRILSPLLFQRVMRQGKSYAGRYLVAFIHAEEGAAGRLGVVASKRTFRRAVDRNRAKRLLREAFRLNRATLTGQDDVVLLARGKILAAKRQAVETDFRAAMWYVSRGGVQPAAKTRPRK